MRVPRAFGRPHAVHVHHGLHPDADSGVEHLPAQCTAFSVELTVRRVRLERRAWPWRRGA